ncbi:MAG: DUF1285 domain-containing protein [Syntrophaceae bacterium]|nr:DUF1285 domain-containing protein [Syntrophaceae bacterium]
MTKAFGKSSISDGDIKIDKEGVWFFRGAEMFRKDFVDLFYQHIKQDTDGRYFIQYGDETSYLDVEDKAFVVKSVHKTCSKNDGKECIELLLSDGTVEILEPDTLYIGCNNVLYCHVKERCFEARFLRPSYYQIAEFIEHDPVNDRFLISLNRETHYIKALDE